jgi:hypothetical protein
MLFVVKNYIQNKMTSNHFPKTMINVKNGMIIPLNTNFELVVIDSSYNCCPKNTFCFVPNNWKITLKAVHEFGESKCEITKSEPVVRLMVEDNAGKFVFLIKSFLDDCKLMISVSQE